jgi:hypothetical protein
VETHSNADRPACERTLALGGGRNCVRHTREGDEEGVALRVDLDPAVGAECASEHSAMLTQRIRVLVSELVEEPCRALDVGEEKRNYPSRKIPPHSAMMSRAIVTVHLLLADCRSR